MSYSSEDYFLSNEFKSLLSKFEANEGGCVYGMLDPDELMDVAEYYYNGRNRQLAEEIIDNTLLIYPGSAPPLLFKARMALLDDDNVTEAERLTEMIEDKTDLEYFYMKAEIMLAQGNIALADKYLEERFGDISDDDRDYFAVDAAALFLDYDSVDLAEKWIDRSEDTDCTEYKEQAARIFVERGEYEKSKTLFNELIDKDPFSVHYWNSLASTQFFNNNIEDSIQSSEYSIAINPDNAAALLNKANGLYNLGNFREALNYYKRYNKQCPRDENGEMLIGFCHMLLDEYEDAITHFKKAETLLPPDSSVLVDIYKDWAFALCRLGRIKESLAILDKTGKLDCDHNEIMVYRGNLLAGSGFSEKAKVCFLHALRESGYSPTVFMKIAITIFEIGDYKLAYRMLRLLYTKYPGWDGGQSQYAACCYDLGYVDEFLVYLKIAAEKEPSELKVVLGRLFPEDMKPQDYYQYMVEKIKRQDIR